MKPISALLLAIGLMRADSLLVLSKGDLTLSIVDPSTLKVIAHMPSGPDPHEVVASADGKTAFRTDPMWFTDYMRRETVEWEREAAEAAE